LTALAARTLADIGADNPRNHIAIVRMPPKASGPSMATILVSRSPFSARDLAELEAVTDRMKFVPTLNLKFAENEIFEQLAVPANHAFSLPTLPINPAPPTDDNPFFFHILRFRQLFRVTAARYRGSRCRRTEIAQFGGATPAGGGLLTKNDGSVA
jgi:hypothetical protein